jgi:outer membrane protein
MNTKNISLILNGILILAVAHLYYLNSQKTPAAATIVPPASAAGGVKIAYVNADTLDAKYEWLKQQKEAIQTRLRNAESSMSSKQQSLEREYLAFQEKAQSGNFSQADLEKEAQGIQQRKMRLDEEAARLERQLAEERQKAFDNLYANIEDQLKKLSSQIGYDYILSYTRGGQILLASDSLDITKQVLELLNAKAPEK